MARKKLSEFSAKTLLFRFLGQEYNGIPIVLKNGEISKEELRITNQELKGKEFVVKVDQGVKGRMKKGLVKLKVSVKDIESAVKELSQKGYSQFLIEEFVPHESVQERYFSIERTREGISVYFASVGGIDIEQNKDRVKKVTIPYSSSEQSESRSQFSTSSNNIKEISDVLKLSPEIFQKILQFFNNQYLSFLEINPFIIHNSQFIILDLAVEVDSTAEFFVKDGWNVQDFTEETKVRTEEEKNIADLQANSQASLKMEVLNPNGSIFVMLFGGGGSIVVADEIYNLGKSKELANYSDYSGGPREQETVIYVENILSFLLKSSAKKKVFIIAGTYANFTDVSITFRGVIKAMEKFKDQLKKQNVKIFVRRPGPNQKIGLQMIKLYLEKERLFGGVWDSSMILSDVVEKAIEYLNS